MLRATGKRYFKKQLKFFSFLMNVEAKKEESGCPPYGKHSDGGCNINDKLSPA